jgi:transcription termination factor NusB
VDLEYYREMQEIVLNKEYFFINLIEKYAPKFEITNMSLLYVLPVFIASAEIFYLKEEIPIKVSVNEAIELAKMF